MWTNLKPLLFRWLLPVATGLLLVVAYPPFNAGQAAWIALVPLLFAVQGTTTGEAFRRGYLAGLVFFGATMWWLVYLTTAGTPVWLAVAGAAGLAAFLALYFGVAGIWFARLLPGDDAADSFSRNLLTIVDGAAGWVVLEWVRGWFLFGGFGWNMLGVSQHKALPLIQFVDVTGVYGVSALLVVFNFAAYFTGRRFLRQMRGSEPMRRLSWEFYGAMLLVCAAFVNGMPHLRQPDPGRTLRLALVQGDIPQNLKFDPAEKPMILERYRSLTEQALADRPVDLIIWPETATPDAVRYDPDSFALVTNIAAQAKTPVLTGTLDFTPYSKPPEAFNAAVLIRPDGTIGQIYRKIHLVPFGEYVPWRKALPFMSWFTPIEGSLERGREFTVFELPLRREGEAPAEPLFGSSAGTSPSRVRFGSVICFEDTVPGVYRQFVRHGAEFMVNLTNDAWFKKSPAAEMHLANAKFRAIETRRPLVRCTNNGVTCIVDERGVERVRLEPFVPGSLNCELNLPADAPVTFYTRHGDIFVAGCVVIAGLTLLVVKWCR
jgi:apolipoprotein N-acyltransferase